MTSFCAFENCTSFCEIVANLVLLISVSFFRSKTSIWPMSGNRRRITGPQFWETKKNGRKQHFSWVTKLPLTSKNVYEVMRAGRARWKIESAPQAHKVTREGFSVKCCKAIGKMVVGPPRSVTRDRPQTTSGGCCQKRFCRKKSLNYL